MIELMRERVSDNLRVELASTVTSLKEQQDKLRKDTEKIAEAEKANLVTIAATYDKMDAARASEILINMSQMQSDEHKASTSSLDEGTSDADGKIELSFPINHHVRAGEGTLELTVTQADGTITVVTRPYWNQ